MQKIVRIGPNAGQIGEMTKEHLHFINEAGESGQIRMGPPFPGCSPDIVGIRTLEPPEWKVYLSGYNKSGVEGVTFIFESYDAAYKLLLDPLLEIGLLTLDAT